MDTATQTAEEFLKTIPLSGLVQMLKTTIKDKTQIETELAIIAELEMRINGLTEHLDKWVEEDWNTCTQGESALEYTELRIAVGDYK